MIRSKYIAMPMNSSSHSHDNTFILAGFLEDADGDLVYQGSKILMRSDIESLMSDIEDLQSTLGDLAPTVSFLEGKMDQLEVGTLKLFSTNDDGELMWDGSNVIPVMPESSDEVVLRPFTCKSYCFYIALYTGLINFSMNLITDDADFVTLSNSTRTDFSVLMKPTDVDAAIVQTIPMNVRDSDGNPSINSVITILPGLPASMVTEFSIDGGSSFSPFITEIPTNIAAETIVVKLTLPANNTGDEFDLAGILINFGVA